ncbi:MAG: anaerobic sulfatase maturase [Prolixibacteraceae bacterium]|nr:anaerobic sulfatase maturase [Prolixibacteraceae bacterium]
MAKKYRPLSSVLVKPAGPDCNLNCTYCFYLEKAELFSETVKHRMSDEIQEELIRQVMQQSGDSVSIAWQGGEPTLMGLDFYRKVVELEKKYGHGQTVGNGLQTNGTLLNEDWAEFLKKYDWLVGLSLDGPEHIHDRYRHDKGGKGSHHTVEKNAQMLLQNGVATNVLATLTDYSVRFPEETYKYFKSLGFDWMQFIPIVETDKNDPSRAAPFSVTAEKYGEFLCKIFDLWLGDFENGLPTTHIRHFDSVFYTYVGLEPPECTMMKECGPYVAVEHNGNVYSCDFFVEPKWKLGNIMNNRITAMLNSKKQQTFGAAKAVLPGECRRCPWLTKCYGGCTKDRIKDPLDQRKPRFCLSYKMFYAHADKTLKLLAETWMQQQRDTEERDKTGGTYNAFKDFLK